MFTHTCDGLGRSYHSVWHQQALRDGSCLPMLCPLPTLNILCISVVLLFLHAQRHLIYGHTAHK